MKIDKTASFKPNEFNYEYTEALLDKLIGLWAEGRVFSTHLTEDHLKEYGDKDVLMTHIGYIVCHRLILQMGVLGFFSIRVCPSGEFGSMRPNDMPILIELVKEYLEIFD